MNYFVITTIPEKRNDLSTKLNNSGTFRKEEKIVHFGDENKCVEIWKSLENFLLLPECIFFDNTICNDEQKRKYMADYIKSFLSDLNLNENDNLYLIIHSRDIHSDVTILEQEEQLLAGDVFTSISIARIYLFRFHHDKRMGFQIFRKPINENYCAELIKMFQE